MRKGLGNLKRDDAYDTDPDDDDNDDEHERQSRRNGQSDHNPTTDNDDGRNTNQSPNRTERRGNERSNTIESVLRSTDDGDGDGPTVEEDKVGKTTPSSTASATNTLPTIDLSMSESSITTVGLRNTGLGAARLPPPTSTSGRRRRRRNDLNKKRSSSRHRRELFETQLKLLSMLSSSSVLMFLFFFLNTLAFLSLVATGTFASLLSYTAYVYVRHLIEEDEDFTMFRFLPSGIQDLMTDMSLHEYLTDDSSYLETRFLMPYFLPGLTDEQRRRIAGRLPRRHRDAVLSPGGFARYFLPGGLYDILSPRNVQGGSGDGAITSMRPSLLSDGPIVEGGNVSSSRSEPQRISDVPSGDSLSAIDESEEERREETTTPFENDMIHVRRMDDGEGREEEGEVTMREAMYGVIGMASSLIRGSPDELDDDDDDDLYFVTEEEEEKEERLGVEGDLSMGSSHGDVRQVDQVCDDDPDYNRDLSESTLGEERSEEPRTSSTVREGTVPSDLSWDSAANNGEIVPVANATNEVGRVGEVTGDRSTNRFGFLNFFRRSAPSTDVEGNGRDEVEEEENDSTTPVLSPPATVTTPNVSSTRINQRPIPPRDERDIASDERQHRLELERAIEEELISETISTMMNNYVETATTMLIDVAQDTVESVAPRVIRVGAALSSISGVGLLGLYTNALANGRAISHGLNSNSVVARRDLSSSSSSNSGRYLMMGLLGTFVTGLASIGSTILMRNYLRRVSAAKRDEVTTKIDESDDNDAPN